MNKDKLLEFTTLEDLKKKQEKTKERIEELEKMNIIKEYITLLKENEKLISEITNYKDNHKKDKIKTCKHDTFIYAGDSIIEHYSDNFLCFRFKCQNCSFEKEFITGIWNNKILFSRTQEIIDFINDHNIISNLDFSKEEFIEYIKEYMYYASNESIDKARSFANVRKIKKHIN